MFAEFNLISEFKCISALNESVNDLKSATFSPLFRHEKPTFRGVETKNYYFV